MSRQNIATPAALPAAPKRQEMRKPAGKLPLLTAAATSQIHRQVIVLIKKRRGTAAPPFRHRVQSAATRWQIAHRLPQPQRQDTSAGSSFQKRTRQAQSRDRARPDQGRLARHAVDPVNTDGMVSRRHCRQLIIEAMHLARLAIRSPRSTMLAEKVGISCPSISIRTFEDELKSLGSSTHPLMPTESAESMQPMGLLSR